MRRFYASLLLLGLVGCQDGPLDPGTRADAVSDALHGGGNPHFYLKPPLVPSAPYAGTFDPTAAPTVTVCEWGGKGCVGQPLATFSREAGRGSERIRMEPGDEQYIVNWHTGKYPVADRRTYRIHFLVGDHVLGYADVTFNRGRREARNARTGETIALVDGTTLPIRFRIEEGALPSGAVQPVAAGALHACAIAQGGAAYCWGQNASGQLGNGTRTSSATPVAVAGGLAFSQVATGYDHTCALDAQGAAYCWGRNHEGQLGRGGFSLSETTPAPVAGGHRFTQLTAGWYHTCALDAEGSVWCWGNDTQGELGDGTTSGAAYSASPVRVAGGPYRQVDAGGMSNCAVTTGEAAVCWGYNLMGQLGSTSGAVSPVPVAVSGGHLFREVHVNLYAGCGLSTGGETLCWGYDQLGTLGRGTAHPAVLAPGPVVGGLAFARLDVGGAHACGVLPDGTAYCWGYNQYGQLGIGSTALWNATPTAVAGTDRWAALSAGTVSTCAVTTTGAGKCWGDNSAGQGGTGSTGAPLSSPTGVSGGMTFAP